MGRLNDICERLVREANGLAAMIVEKGGHELARAGDADRFDVGRLASYAADPQVVTYGETCVRATDHLHVSRVGERALLAVLFDGRSSLGLVRLRAKKAVEEISKAIEQDPDGSGGAAATRS